MNIRMTAVLALLCAPLAGCEIENWPPRLGNPDDARLTLAVTDAPADEAAEVVVAFTGVQFQNEDGGWERFDISMDPVDLLELQGVREKLLDEVGLEPGEYRFVRLLIDEARSYVVVSDGGQHPLTVDDGDDNDQLFGIAETFTMPSDGLLDLTIDIDLRRSLTGSAQQSLFTLRPALRLVETEETGTITGTVDDRMVQSNTCTNGASNDIGNAVYVFAGNSAELNDIGSGAGPVTTAPVRQQNGSYTYRASYLPEGPYTVAFTCRAADDDPQTDDPLEQDSSAFGEAVDATVTAGATTTVNLAP